MLLEVTSKVFIVQCRCSMRCYNYYLKGCFLMQDFLRQNVPVASNTPYYHCSLIQDPEVQSLTDTGKTSWSVQVSRGAKVRTVFQTFDGSLAPIHVHNACETKPNESSGQVLFSSLSLSTYDPSHHPWEPRNVRPELNVLV